MVSYTLESSGRYGDPSGRIALIQSLRQAFAELRINALSTDDAQLADAFRLLHFAQQ